MPRRVDTRRGIRFTTLNVRRKTWHVKRNPARRSRRKRPRGSRIQSRAPKPNELLKARAIEQHHEDRARREREIADFEAATAARTGSTRRCWPICSGCSSASRRSRRAKAATRMASRRCIGFVEQLGACSARSARGLRPNAPRALCADQRARLRRLQWRRWQEGLRCVGPRGPGDRRRSPGREERHAHRATTRAARSACTTRIEPDEDEPTRGSAWMRPRFRAPAGRPPTAARGGVMATKRPRRSPGSRAFHAWRRARRTRAAR